MHTNYIQVTFTQVSEEQSAILIAQLSELGFDGFEENENLLKAFTAAEKFSASELDNLNLTYSTEIIPSTNWNEEWEKNFDPVVVDNFVAVRADFHKPIKNVTYEIIITPKMSFGTGHHATTFMMMQEMRTINFNNKTVFDFGTGTGILAILSEKIGAKSVFAIDNDDWSIENAQENAERNGSRSIDFELRDDPSGTGTFDIILANINKNIILTYLSVLVSRLNKNGHLLLSGLLKEDEADIQHMVKQLNINYIRTSSRDKWICLHYSN